MTNYCQLRTAHHSMCSNACPLAMEWASYLLACWK